MLCNVRFDNHLFVTRELRELGAVVHDVRAVDFEHVDEGLEFAWIEHDEKIEV